MVARTSSFTFGRYFIVELATGKHFECLKICCFQGVNSSQDEKAASALHAMKLDNDVNGKAIQVRVTQNNEPRHFLKMFQGDYHPDDELLYGLEM